MGTGVAKKPRAGNQSARRDAVINLRVPLAMRALIDNAAEVLGKTRTAFIIESCRKEATDVLLDQRLFVLSEREYDAFQTALDEPPASNEKLKRLLTRKSPWES